ncbi:MAG: MFS transporter [SAR202 cluster bacterium]|nr:MFS transporter [SAR202 cluster bacterium]MDP6664550.1 MFS transporter [SAR202 cluster bacterium]MDP6800167.1 MFS transporter [SAR202 cluster bacterium]
MRTPKNGLWRNPDFLKLWSAQSVSVMGSVLGALQFTAILTLDAEPLHMSALTAFGVAPALVLGVFAGAWVDRLRRRPILIATDLVRMALLGSIPVAWQLDSLSMEQLYVVAFFHGLMTMFFDVAYRSYLPSLVPSTDLVEANSKLSASAAVAEVGGFSLGGWLAQVFSAVAVAAVDAASFFVSGLLLAWIRKPEPEPASDGERPGMVGEVVIGLRFVAGNPVLRAMGVSKAAMGVGGGIFSALIVIYGIETLGFQPGVLGTIFAIGGVSSICGAMAATRVTRRVGIGKTLVLGLIIFGASGFLIPLARGPLLVAGALLAVQQLFDFAIAIYEINQVSIRQGIVSSRMLGRVNASIEVTSLGARLMGAVAAGALAEVVGLRWGLAVGAAVMMAGGLVLVRSAVWGVVSVPGSDRPG